jgi:hypothetical protein
MGRLKRALLGLLMLALASVGTNLVAQARPKAGLCGAVTDGAGPLAGASVEVLGEKRSVLTGASGEFWLDQLRPGRYWVSVRRIGYRPVTFTATLEADSVRRVAVTLEQAPYKLSDLEVSGGMSRNRYVDFMWRSRGAWGRFLTRDDIRRAHAFDPVDLVLRYLPSRTRWTLEQPAWFDPGYSFGGADWVPAGARGRTLLDCAPGVSINGSSPWPGNSINDYQLDEIEAVEVYRKVEWVPIEFSRNATACGLVVVWLK